MSLENDDILILRKMLMVLSKIGPLGLEKADLFEQTQLAASVPVKTSDLENRFRILKNKGWIYDVKQPMTGRMRWVITEVGKTAYKGL